MLYLDYVYLNPMENNLSELWSLMDFLMPGYFGGLEAFKKEYSRPIEQGDIKKQERLKVNLSPLMLRRLKEEVATIYQQNSSKLIL